MRVLVMSEQRPEQLFEYMKLIARSENTSY